MPDGFHHVVFNDIKSLEASLDNSVAAVLLETVQGEGGVIPASNEYLQAVRELCTQRGILMMIDEAGSDEKILAVPIDKVFNGYSHIHDIEQVSSHWLERIGHFFEHYKDLEKGKWVKLDGWRGVDEAKNLLLNAARAKTYYQDTKLSAKVAKFLISNTEIFSFS